ncbi:MAG: virulence protein RhuM/Fic/DOC family protein [Proteobacteria bacterium]|nr:virulence protein RhuM/Fic/DOC family protein [Pseudomonadota bacterium]MBU1547387.1 virulence protein RhuM/Fic/DOC family protein [Pseudomonadota bacterium]MBU2619005.1 virulence protein RhuM/Fic/DOC family protein [Pseudomonadota bacterium]
MSQIEAQVAIYQTADGQVQLDVTLEQDTVWLSQGQMVELFGRDVSVISRHISNALTEGEISQKSNLQKMQIANSDRPVVFYDLDVVISVGYRIKSERGVQFRRWATNVLRQHLVQGYTLNTQRLQTQQEHIKQLERTLTLFQQNLIEQASLPEARGLVSVIAGYARTFVLLNQFDSERLPLGDFATAIRYEIQPAEAVAGIAALKADLMAKNEASELFGNQKDDSFAGILGNIVQSFGGEFLYPSIEEQGAHLLYFVIKNHPFSDGNKRIGAFLFIWFLQRNQHHLKTDGELKINDNALAAIALLVAQSDPGQKQLMIHLIMNLIRG